MFFLLEALGAADHNLSLIHICNTFTARTALLLDGVSGGLAGAIGLALAEILAGDPGYAVTTFVQMCIRDRSSRVTLMPRPLVFSCRISSQCS